MKYIKFFEKYKLFPNSKMIDKNGELLIYYHGVGKLGKFKEFDENLIGSTSGNFGHYGKGFYFTNSKNAAKSFSQMYGGTGEVIEAYLNIVNPFIVNEVNLIHIGEKYKLNLPKKIPIALDIDYLLSKLKNIDPIAYKLLELLNKYDYQKGWEKFLKNNDIEDSKIDLNLVSDWYEETKGERYGRGVSDYTIEELKDIGITPKLVYDYEENLNMAYLTNLGQDTEEWTNVIKKEGYDGIDAGDEIVVFDKSQIHIID